MSPAPPVVPGDMKLLLEYGHDAGAGGSEDVYLRVVLTSRRDPGTPDNAAAMARAAFDDWMAEMTAQEIFGPPGLRGGGVWLKDGHVVSVESDQGYRVHESQPRVRDDVGWLAGTGAASGPPGYSSRRRATEGEWLLSKRTGFWTLRGELYREGSAG